MIKSCWIRPEDIGAYEALGYTNFKILERGMPSPDVVKRVRAYSERKYQGNLAELLFYYGFKEPQRRQFFWIWKYFIKPRQVRIQHLTDFFSAAKGQGMGFEIAQLPIRIDSDKIPSDFIEQFKTSDCTETDCEKCGYCRQIANEAVRINADFKRSSIQSLSKINLHMVEGKLWI